MSIMMCIGIIPDAHAGWQQGQCELALCPGSQESKPHSEVCQREYK